MLCRTRSLLHWPQWLLTCSNRAVSNCKISKELECGRPLLIRGKEYQVDKWTNVTSRLLSHVDRKLYQAPKHPLNLVFRRISNHFNRFYRSQFGSPMFTIVDSLSPVVTVKQNFDSLLVPTDHVSRRRTDTYYVNEQYLLRSHTSAHQAELISSGLDAFLVVGDVYRRDDIDVTHYPVFHQLEGVKLFTKHELFAQSAGDANVDQLAFLTDPTERTRHRQERHSVDVVKLVERNLKDCLLGVATNLFGADIQYRWTEVYFPFTHPSWELEIQFDGHWMEVLGCGVVEQRLLQNTGAGDRVGWAFGLGLERLAMKMYSIPDIRLFWSTDSGFLSQFEHVDNPETDVVTFKPISIYPQCTNDMSFWIPDNFSKADFLDLVRSIGGELVEQVLLVDDFVHPRSGRRSNMFRIVYRHVGRTLTQAEVNVVHNNIGAEAQRLLGVEIRINK